MRCQYTATIAPVCPMAVNKGTRKYCSLVRRNKKIMAVKNSLISTVRTVMMDMRSRPLYM